jgi:hypothetical protein
MALHELTVSNYSALQQDQRITLEASMDRVGDVAMHDGFAALQYQAASLPLMGLPPLPRNGSSVMQVGESVFVYYLGCDLRPLLFSTFQV